MNIAIITGNLARDPEYFATSNGVSRCTMTVAVQRRVPNAQGVREADFLTVVAWRQAADYCNKYLHKGSKVAVEGNIQVRSYNAQDGSKRYVTEIIADRVEGLDRRNTAENGPVNVVQQTAQQTKGQQNTQQAGMDDFAEVDDDDLPF